MQSLYVCDGTGNPAALLSSGAYTAFAYDPYGVRDLTTGAGGNGTTRNPYTFKAGIQDRVTGRVKFGARWYDPTLGRWTRHDTLDAPLDPKNANRYAYAANDPINNSDPTGQFLEDPGTACLYNTPICVGCRIQSFLKLRTIHRTTSYAVWIPLPRRSRPPV